MTRKSRTCKTKEGEFRYEYDTEWEAQQGADHANSEYGRDLIPYRCEICGKYHISPRDRQTPSVECKECEKDLYLAEDDAENRASIILDEKGVSLKVYKCPAGRSGWHLTSQGA